MSGIASFGDQVETDPVGARPLRVVYLVRSWPRLSQTFVLNEVLAMQRAGVVVDVFSMVRAEEALVQPDAAMVSRPVRYLSDLRGTATRVETDTYRRALEVALNSPNLAGGYANASTMECFHSAANLASALDGTGPVDHVHAHFAHDPTLVAYFLHLLTGLSYSFTAHARDLYGVPPEALITRARPATAVVTCCEANGHYLRATLTADLSDRISVIHHGVDLAAFEAPQPGGTPSMRTQVSGDRTTSGVTRIISVGRLVQKKGFEDLLAACDQLDPVRFTLDIYGEGPLLAQLEAERHRLNLDDRVTFQGARVHRQILKAMAEADIFALTPYVTGHGDRDGVPNVLVEAMASGLPVVTTTAGGIGDLVEHDHNGLLAEPHSVGTIAGNLHALITDAGRRSRLAAAARRTVEERFNVASAASRLISLFGANGPAR